MNWTSPLEVKRPKKCVGRGGMAVKVGRITYRSIAQAARVLGLHKAVINRMLRDGEATKA